MCIIINHIQNLCSNRHCLGYCYERLLRESLAEFVNLWNSHYIRKSHGARCPSGVPNTLYSVPEVEGMH